MNEQWMPVVGYERLYEVSDMGRVKSLAAYHAANREQINARHREYRALKAAV